MHMNVIKYLHNYLIKNKYNIGFVQNDINSILNGDPLNIKWLKHSFRDRWFADPFILEVNNKEITILAEEWYYPINKGRISKLVIDKKDYKLKYIKIVLELDTHLSFPAIERINDNIYIHPENSLSGYHKIYKYNKQKEIFEEHSTLCKLPLTDSICTQLFGSKLMFSTKLPDANGNVLGIYEWDDDQREYKFKEEIILNDNIARMAGNFFTFNGCIYRPAQVCIKSYGDAVSIQQISYNNQWTIKEIRRLYSPNKKLDLGFHTFNIYDGNIVVDALGYRHPFVCHLILLIYRLSKLKGTRKD